MEAELFKLLIDSGGLALCIGLILYFNRRDAERQKKRDEERLEEQRRRDEERTREEREDKILMINTLQHNTEVLSELTTVVKRLNGREH